jgi:hypothetical protein
LHHRIAGGSAVKTSLFFPPKKTFFTLQLTHFLACGPERITSGMEGVLCKGDPRMTHSSRWRVVCLGLNAGQRPVSLILIFRTQFRGEYPKGDVLHLFYPNIDLSVPILTWIHPCTNLSLLMFIERLVVILYAKSIQNGVMNKTSFAFYYKRPNSIST